MLQMCIKHLGYEDTDAQKSAWVLERENAVSTLRQLCEEFGDNDWDENIFLSDVIEKHLGKHLHTN